MAGRYPDYDWRGIAMLTQQLGQLFEPSKAKMMSQQQEHEMHMLMAKQAWKTQSESLELKKIEYNKLTDDIATYTEKVEALGLGELVSAGMSDGSTPGAASEILNDNEINTLKDLHVLSGKYREVIRAEQGNLDNLKLYDTIGKAGEQWRKGSMTKKDRKGVMVDYYEAANKDKIPGLSYDEGQNMIKRYIKDNFFVAEGEKDSKGELIPSMEITFGSGDKTESFMVKPEALAFRAGYEIDTGKGTGRGKAEKEEISDKQAIITAQNKLLGGKTPLNMTDEELIASAKRNKQIFSDIDKNSGLNHSLGILLEMVDGQFVGTKAAEGAGFSQDDVIMYSAAYTNYTNATQEMLNRPDIEMPGAVSTGQYDSSALQDFSVYGTHPDSLMTQISLSNKNDMEFVLNSYNDFLQRLPELSPVKRREGILTYQDWLTKK